MKPSIALIGPGKVGCAVAQRLLQADYSLQAVIGRDLQRAIDACRFIGCPETVAGTDLAQSAEAEIVLLAVPDDQIQELAKKLPTRPNHDTDQVLIHFSGLHTASIMRNTDAANLCLSIHPLLPFANRLLASQKLTGCPCALEGDEAAIPLGEELVSAFGGQPFCIGTDQKALYHAGACIASNFFVSLIATAADVLSMCHIDPETAASLLLPLVQASLDNVERLGTQQGLTGPIVRGDLGTVAAHIFALQESAPELLPLYQLLGTKTLELAEKSTRLPQQQAEQLHRLIDSATLAQSSASGENPSGEQS